MKHYLVACFMFAAVFSSTFSLAQDIDYYDTTRQSTAYSDPGPERGYRMALGLRLSNTIPTLNNSVSAKYFITDRSAVEGLISFGSRFGIGALLEIYQPFSTPGLSWFYGAGAYAGFESNADKNGNGGGETFVGPTGILGLDYKFPNAPVNLSVDWKPELDIVPSINFVPDAFALSVRFAFGK